MNKLSSTILLKKKIYKGITLFSVALMALSVVACSSTTKTSESQSEDPAMVQVENLGEVTFKEDPANSSGEAGVFDVVNGSSELNHTITKGTPIEIAGWAILKDQNKPADQVIVTAGDDNSVVAVVPVNVTRSDVSQHFKNPAIEKSGWSYKIEPDKLSSEGDKAVLKAWAYNTETKEANLINQVHQITLK